MILSQLEVQDKNKQWLLIADYLAKDVAEILQKENHNYLDVAGNASIKTNNLFIFIEGKKKEAAEKKNQSRAFQEAGLKFNDKIMEVNGKSTKGMSTTDVVALIKDAKRKDANIKIERDGTTLEFDVEKREVVIESVESKTYDVNGKKIGYVVINTFANNTYSQFRSNVEQLEKENQ